MFLAHLPQVENRCVVSVHTVKHVGSDSQAVGNEQVERQGGHRHHHGGYPHGALLKRVGLIGKAPNLHPAGLDGDLGEIDVKFRGHDTARRRNPANCRFNGFLNVSFLLPHVAASQSTSALPHRLDYHNLNGAPSLFRHKHKLTGLALIDRSFSELSDRTAPSTAVATTPGRVADESPAHPNSMDERTPCLGPWLGPVANADTLCINDRAVFPSRWGRGTIGGEEYEYLNLASIAESRREGRAVPKHAGTSRVSVLPHQTDCGAHRRKAVSRLRAVVLPPRRRRTADGHQFKFGERAGTCRERGPMRTAALAQMCPDGRSKLTSGVEGHAPRRHLGTLGVLGPESRRIPSTTTKRSSRYQARPRETSHCRFHIVAGDPGRRRIGVSVLRQVYGSTNHTPAYRADRFPSLIAHSGAYPSIRANASSLGGRCVGARLSLNRFLANRFKRGAFQHVEKIGVSRD